MIRAAIVALVCLSAAAGSGCDANQPNCGSGPCVTNHAWGPTEIAADLSGVPFQPASNRRDHLYQVHCRITHGGAGATCTGHRALGPHPKRIVTARVTLRSIGSWDLICWPQPSSLCARVQIREQRRDPISVGSG